MHPRVLGLHLYFFAGMKAERFLESLVILSLFQASISSSYGIVLPSGFADQGIFWVEKIKLCLEEPVMQQHSPEKVPEGAQFVHPVAPILALSGFCQLTSCLIP